MSSAGITVAGDGASLYFCHKCSNTVTITPSPTGDLLCPTCNSDFVEEYEEPDPDPDPYPNFPDPGYSLFSTLFNPSRSTTASLDSQNPRIYSSAQNPRDEILGSGGFDPIGYLMTHLSSQRASGINFEFVIEGGNGGSGLGLPANIGDYFIGPHFEELIQQLAENDPNRYGTPPASKSAVEGLPSIKVNEELLKSELAQCAVCKDDFELGLDVKQLPCKHVYHEGCILPWLELHNSCPVCRYELPTDDPDYENRGRDNAGGGESSGGGGSGGSGSGGSGGAIGGRRFTTIALQWPWGNFEGSESRGGQQNRESN
ncbi:E3 ubiquitin-protein ligase RING1-like [Nicotiana tabacum]|uniref:E3 ubiquitin-protein ligase RING1-like n=1 Tax=Nicotiana tabacum TaxID=4097 RepID=A0AC58U002_TOBAC